MAGFQGTGKASAPGAAASPRETVVRSRTPRSPRPVPEAGCREWRENRARIPGGHTSPLKPKTTNYPINTEEGSLIPLSPTRGQRLASCWVLETERQEVVTPGLHELPA